MNPDGPKRLNSIKTCGHQQVKLISDVAINCTKTRVKVEVGQALTDMAALLIHAAAVMTGHASKVAAVQRQHKQPRQSDKDTERRQFCMETAAETAKTRRLAAEQPDDANLAACALVAETWSEATLEMGQSDTAGEQIVQQSFHLACKQGGAAIERWLTRSLKRAPPQLEFRTDSKKRKIIDSRRKIGALDPKCDLVSDQAALVDMEQPKRVMRKRIDDGSECHNPNRRTVLNVHCRRRA